MDNHSGQPLADPAWLEAVAFLARWLPQEAKQAYRELIRANPDHWSRHPHFAGGMIIRHALRGNGIDERSLGVADLNTVWPALLRSALEIPDA